MEINEIIKEFNNYKIVIEGISKNTINQYNYRLNKFIVELNIKNIDDLINKKQEDIVYWLSNLTENGNFPQSRNGYLTAIKELYSYIFYEKEMIIDNKILRLKNAKTIKKEKYYLNEVEFNKLAYFIINERTRAMVEVIWCTGARFSDLIQIKTQDVEKGYVKVLGKGNKERTLYFDERCLKYVNKYMKNKRKHILDNTKVKTDLLFISNNGKLIDRGNFEKSLKHYGQVAGIEWYEHLSPHKIRHSYATYKLQERDDNGALINDIATISYSMGHSNISTTNTYIHTNDDMVKKMQTGGK